jgi:hypothetical protein
MPARWGGPLPPDDPIFSKGIISVFGRPSAPVEEDDELDDDRHDRDDEQDAEAPADEHSE